jgi:hypothetical protein
LTQGPDHFIELPLIESACRQLALQFVQLLLGARQPVLVGAERKCSGLNMLQIFADSRKEALPHVFAAESIVAIPVIGVVIAIATITVATIPTVAVVSRISIAIVAPVISPVGARLPARVRWRRSLTTRIPSAPRQIKCISFRTVVRILDSNYRRAAVARIADQRLPASAIHA